MHNAHARRPLRPYIRKTTDLPPKNPDNIPCLCKHLIAFGQFLSNDNYMLSRTPISKITKSSTPDLGTSSFKTFTKDELAKKLKTIPKKPNLVEPEEDEAKDV